jgi:CDP-2,3-bis-(O-geranylgeranyl)-sn-glycerol synthase
MFGQSVLSEVFSAFWFILPAYIANGGALVIGGGSPLDGGRIFSDGRRVIGDGVTVRGTIGGIAAGTAMGTIQGLASSDIAGGLLVGLLMGIGAMFGDSLGSFTKRRLGIARGRAAPGLDQLGFLVFAIVFASLATEVSLTTVAILLILTPTIHLCTNVLAYKLGIKKVWY